MPQTFTTLAIVDANTATQNVNVIQDGSGHYTPWSSPSDGTNPIATLFDLDTGGGTEFQVGFNIRISAPGGSIEAKGQQTMANSLPFTMASDQTGLPTLSQGALTAGTAPTKCEIVGGQYNSALPSPTTGQTVAIQVDASGRLIIAPLPTGANVIGALSANQSVNTAQVGGANVPTPALANVASLPAASRANDLYIAASGALTTSGTSTALALSALTEAGNTIFSAREVTLAITNPTASAQTITAGNLQFSDTVGANTPTITYNLLGTGGTTTLSIGAGSTHLFTIPLTEGVLKTPTVNVTFGSNPSAATLNVLAIFRSSTGSTFAPTVIFGDVNSSGDNAVVAAVSGKRVKVKGFCLQAANSAGTNTNTVYWEDTSATQLSQKWDFQAREGVNRSAADGDFVFQSAVGKGVQLNLSVAQHIYYQLEYTIAE